MNADSIGDEKRSTPHGQILADEPVASLTLTRHDSSGSVISTASGLTDDCIEELGQENDDGNVEYKWKLIDKSPERIQHLTTQMKYRLTEGQGETIYMVGVEDNGHPKGLPTEDLEASIETLRSMAHSLNAELLVLRRMRGEEGKCAEILIRRLPEDRAIIDIKVCVIGNVDSGKTTLVGVLTRGKLDNGRGSARADVFRHRHEIENGRTSAIAHEIMGFDSQGEIANYSKFRKGWSDIIQASSKLVTFIDLAGHERYLKTTVYGLTSVQPDYALIAVASNNGILRMTKEHLGVSLALKIPIFFVLTKVDLCPPNILEQTLADLMKILRSSGVRREPLVVESEDHVMSAFRAFSSHGKVTPIFCVSNVSGDGLELLKKFLNLLPKRRSFTYAVDQPAQFSVDGSYWVAGVGTVCTGMVMKGQIAVNDTLLLGPNSKGAFSAVTVKSIHYKRISTKSVQAGQHCSLALKKIKRSLVRRGMILAHPASEPRPAFGFDAEVRVLFHPNAIQPNYEAVLHCGTICQTVKLVVMNAEALHTGEKAIATFKFIQHPEYLAPGSKFVFRDGRTKAIGKVVKVHYSDPTSIDHKYLRRAKPSPSLSPQAALDGQSPLSLSSPHHLSDEELKADLQNFDNEWKEGFIPALVRSESNESSSSIPPPPPLLFASSSYSFHSSPYSSPNPSPSLLPTTPHRSPSPLPSLSSAASWNLTNTVPEALVTGLSAIGLSSLTPSPAPPPAPVATSSGSVLASLSQDSGDGNAVVVIDVSKGKSAKSRKKSTPQASGQGPQEAEPPLLSLYADEINDKTEKDKRRNSGTNKTGRSPSLRAASPQVKSMTSPLQQPQDASLPSSASKKRGSATVSPALSALPPPLVATTNQPSALLGSLEARSRGREEKEEGKSNSKKKSAGLFDTGSDEEEDDEITAQLDRALDKALEQALDRDQDFNFQMPE